MYRRSPISSARLGGRDRMPAGQACWRAYTTVVGFAAFSSAAYAADEKLALSGDMSMASRFARDDTLRLLSADSRWPMLVARAGHRSRFKSALLLMKSYAAAPRACLSQRMAPMISRDDRADTPFPLMLHYHSNLTRYIFQPLADGRAADATGFAPAVAVAPTTPFTRMGVSRR